MVLKRFVFLATVCALSSCQERSFNSEGDGSDTESVQTSQYKDKDSFILKSSQDFLCYSDIEAGKNCKTIEHFEGRSTGAHECTVQILQGQEVVWYYEGQSKINCEIFLQGDLPSGVKYSCLKKFKCNRTDAFLKKIN